MDFFGLAKYASGRSRFEQEASFFKAIGVHPYVEP